jgi:crossover junction endodeoxyribonuclease RuvC
LIRIILNEIAIEALFGKNVQSMLKLGRAGVAMAAGLSRDIPITEYEPKKIKMAITKMLVKQVAKMLQQLWD